MGQTLQQPIRLSLLEYHCRTFTLHHFMKPRLNNSIRQKADIIAVWQNFHLPDWTDQEKMVHLQIWKELFRCNQMQHLMQFTSIGLYTWFVNKKGYSAAEVKLSTHLLHSHLLWMKKSQICWTCPCRTTTLLRIPSCLDPTIQGIRNIRKTWSW